MLLHRRSDTFDLQPPRPQVWCPLRVRALCYCRWNSWTQRDPSASVRPTQRRVKQSTLYLCRRQRLHRWLRDPMLKRSGRRPILSRRCLPHDVSHVCSLPPYSSNRHWHPSPSTDRSRNRTLLFFPPTTPSSASMIRDGVHVFWPSCESCVAPSPRWPAHPSRPRLEPMDLIPG